MKKVILMAVAMLASVASFAQHATGTITIQPKVGIAASTFDDADNAETIVGFVGGAEFEYQATDIFSISAGALYTMQGSKATTNFGLTGKQKIDYINIPILANVYPFKGFAVKLGLQPGFKVNDEFTLSAGNHEYKSDNTKAKSFALAIPVGVSYEFKNFVLDARYNWGVTKVFDDADIKNSVFQVTLGYKFEL